MKFKSAIFFFVFSVISLGCSSSKNVEEELGPATIENPDDDSAAEYAEIDFSNWKVTLPIEENNNGSPDEYQPNTLVNGNLQSYKKSLVNENTSGDDLLKTSNMTWVDESINMGYVKYYELYVTH